MATDMIARAMARRAERSAEQAPSKKYELIGTVDFSDDVQGFNFSGLPGYTEIFIIRKQLVGKENTASGVGLYINGINVMNVAIPFGKSGEPYNGYSVIRALPGIGIQQIISGSSNSNATYYITSLASPINVITNNIESITEIKGAITTGYTIASGQITLWGKR